MTLVLNNNAHYLDYEVILDRIDKHLEKNNTTGINIDFDYGYFSDIYPRIESLIESNIIFDKSGKTTEVRDKMQEYIYTHPFYLVEYVPPIDEHLTLKLKK